MARPGHPSLDDRVEDRFEALCVVAQELAESWINGNKGYVLEILGRRSARSVSLALLVAETLHMRKAGSGLILARTLYRRSQ